MSCLSVATAKGRLDTAGCRKLAVFFLTCLLIFSSCSARNSVNKESEIPFVKNGRLYSFSSDSKNQFITKSYESYLTSEGYTQRAVSSSLKNGYILAWDKKKQSLYHIDNNQKLRCEVKLNGYISFVDKNYVLTQTNSFDENKGFCFSLYQLKYSYKKDKLKLKQIWKGNIDCFVSDCFFTEDGICICGGNREDTKNNVFYITKKGIHKCFSTEKKSDFLRILNTENGVYAFLSGRDKSAAKPLIYKFSLTGNSNADDIECTENLNKDSLFPSDFDCFFGYGFTMPAVNQIVLPASVNGSINFICYDYNSKTIKNVVSDVTGCVAVLGLDSTGVYYMARDPLIEGSYYGTAFFDGNTCIKLWDK